MIYRFADYSLDTSLFELRRGFDPCAVEPQVFEILRYLVEHRDRMVTREELIDAIWSDRFVADTTVSSRIKEARKAIGDDGRNQLRIRTVHGRGFRFVADVTEEEGMVRADGMTGSTSIEPAADSVLPGSSSELRDSRTTLFERDEPILVLQRILEEVVRRSSGQVVLIAGEAGIGKSSVISSFCQMIAGVEILTGGCDALTTPRPLGPLHDIARQAGGDFAETLSRGPDRHIVLAALLSRLERSPVAVVLVVEDVHWADEATIDLLVSLARRISGLRVMLIASYRSDEVGHRHPLRRLLGQFATTRSTRIDLEPLSSVAVGQLSGVEQEDAERLHAMTGGNPFFLTEVLANPSGELPPTVRDAVLGRIARLSPDAREIIELISAVPGKFPLETLLSLRPGRELSIDEALEVGTILSDSESLWFRHELARISVYDSLPPVRSLLLHRQLLEHLLTIEETSRDLAAIIHHARALGDVSIIRAHAPEAARKASAAGAHLEALAHYECALEHDSAFSREQVAEILEGISFEIYLTGDTDRAISFRDRALGLRRELGNELEAGSNLRWMSRLHWFAGRNDEARRYAAQAVALLETLPPSSELAMAYSNRSQLAMLESRLEGVLRWGGRAIELAEELGDREVLAHALTNVGLGRLIAGQKEGQDILEQALGLCLEQNFQEHAVRAITGLGTVLISRKDYPEGIRYLEEGIDYCVRNDLDSWSPYLEAYLARAELETGDWNSAGARATSVLARDGLPAITRIAALAPLGLLKLRLGDDDGELLLQEALLLAQRTGELQRLAPSVSGLSEAGWLEGSFADVLGVLSTTFNLAMKRNRVVEREQLSYWLWKSGHKTSLPEIETPFGLQIAGRWRDAAAAWQRIGCPWEQAMALAEGDEEATGQAIRMMRSLGSTAGAAAVERDARQRGVVPSA